MGFYHSAFSVCRSSAKWYLNLWPPYVQIASIYLKNKSKSWRLEPLQIRDFRIGSELNIVRLFPVDVPRQLRCRKWVSGDAADVDQIADVVTRLASEDLRSLIWQVWKSGTLFYFAIQNGLHTYFIRST